MARRKYTDAERATALAALKTSSTEDVSEATGIPVRTLRAWRADPPRGAAELSPAKEADLAAELERVAHRLVNAIPDKIDGAALNHVAVALGITIDKLRLLKGESTEVTEVRDGNAKRDLLDLLDRLPARASDTDRATN
jgi:transposase-like protein